MHSGPNSAHIIADSRFSKVSVRQGSNVFKTYYLQTYENGNNVNQFSFFVVQLIKQYNKCTSSNRVGNYNVFTHTHRFALFNSLLFVNQYSVI